MGKMKQYLGGAILVIVMQSLVIGYANEEASRHESLTNAVHGLYSTGIEAGMLTDEQIFDAQARNPNLVFEIRGSDHQFTEGVTVSIPAMKNMAVNVAVEHISATEAILAAISSSWLSLVLAAGLIVALVYARTRQEDITEDLLSSSSLGIDKQRADITYDIAHNIRTHIASLSGMVTQLQSLNLSRRQAEVVNRITESTNGIDRHTHELAAFVNMDAESVSEIIQEIDLVFDVESILQSLAPALDRKNVYADFIPEKNQSFNVRIKGNLFYYLTNNFLCNALLMTEKGSGFVVRLGADVQSDNGDRIKLSIEFPNMEQGQDTITDHASRLTKNQRHNSLLPSKSKDWKCRQIATDQGVEIGEGDLAGGGKYIWASIPCEQASANSAEQIELIQRSMLCGHELSILIADGRKTFVDSLQSRLSYINVIADTLDTSDAGGTTSLPQYDLVCTRDAGVMPDSGLAIKQRAAAKTLISFESVYDEAALDLAEGAEPINLAITTHATLTRMVEYLNYWKIDRQSNAETKSIATKPASVMPALGMISGKPMANINILIIEDNKLNQVMLFEGLTLRGAKVVMAATGREGILCAQEKRYDIIMLDLQLPDLSGSEVGQAIKIAGPNQITPIIGISANARARSDKSFSAVVNDIITNKGDLDEITTIILSNHHRPIMKKVSG